MLSGDQGQENEHDLFLLALLLFEEGVAVGLLLVQQACVVELGGVALRLPLPLGHDLTLFLDLLVGVVELLLELLLERHHLL